MANRPGLSPCRKLFRLEHRSSKMKTASQDQVPCQMCSLPLLYILFAVTNQFPLKGRDWISPSFASISVMTLNKKCPPEPGLYHPSGWATHTSIACKQQKSTCQPFLTGVEQLVDHGQAQRVGSAS